MGRLIGDYHDVVRKLDGTFVKYKGEFYYARVRDGRTRSKDLSLYDGDMTKLCHEVSHTDKDLHYKWPMKIGYINTKNGSRYLSRSYAAQKYGFSPQCYTWSTRERQGITGPEWEAMLKGDFPTWQHAFAKAISSGKSWAFHPYYAIKKVSLNTLGLYYKKALIATANKSTKSFTFLKDLPNLELIKRDLKRNGFNGIC